MTELYAVYSEKYYKQIIADSAEAIRAKIKDSKLYGLPIDMENADMVLVAAVFLTQFEESHKFQRDIDFLTGLHSI